MRARKTLAAAFFLLFAAGLSSGQKHAGATRPADAHFTYRRDILPILHAKCEPCHFAGGKVYAKLPFTDSSVVAKLGARLDTRLKDSTDKAIILSWSSHLPAQ